MEWIQGRCRLARHAGHPAGHGRAHETDVRKPTAGGKGVKVAAYQAPLFPAGSAEAMALIRQRVEQCEAEGVAILCCPEAILGGLADYADDPSSFAISTNRIESALAPLASDAVTTIVGLTERTDTGRLYNAAAVLHRGAVLGVYRKLHPAINRSVYEPGRDTPVF